MLLCYLSLCFRLVIAMLHPSLFLHRQLVLSMFVSGMAFKGPPSGSVVRSLPAVLEMQVRSLGQEDPREANGNPLQYFYLGNLLDRGAWLQSTGSQRVRYDLATEQQQQK